MNPRFNFLIAIVSLDQEKLQQYAHVNGLQDLENEQLIRTQDVEFAVLKQLERISNMHNLDKVERIVRVHITGEPFSYKNGVVCTGPVSIEEGYN